MQRPTPSWLKNAVFYEIYPQSFCDTNADGIGDLQGVIAKLDYVRSLGCNAIWLNPCFESPFGDAGYDVSDFCKVAPRYGTNEDLVRLFEEAHKRGIKIILDLVAGHTSVDHPWFKESARHERNEYSDYYIWTSSAWEAPGEDLFPIRGHSERNGGYLPNFFHFQPALNFGFAEPDPRFPWQQPASAPGPQAVRQELIKIMKYWLDLGCDGFRVDMAESLIKGKGEAKLNAMRGFWQDIRAWFDKDWPEAVLIAEWSKPHEAIEAGFHIDFLIHFGQPAYNSLFRTVVLGEAVPGGGYYFSPDGNGDITIFTGYYDGTYEATRELGYISIPTGNHDIVPRLADHRTPEQLRVALAFLFTMPGIPVIYQGDEIALHSSPNLPSKEGGYERTSVRTPVLWDASQPGAGFSQAEPTKFYLPLGQHGPKADVASQEADPESILHFTRKLVQLRKDHPALGSEGLYRSVLAESKTYPFVYERELDGAKYQIAVNPTENAVEHTFEKDGEVVLSQNVKALGSGKHTLGGASYVILKIS